MPATDPRRKDRCAVWVLSGAVDQAMLERSGDARRVADQLGARVGALVRTPTAAEAEQLLAYGVDRVYWMAAAAGQRSLVATTATLLTEHHARLVFAAGDGAGREWAALLAVRLGWKLVTPALVVQARGQRLEVTGLDRSGRLARNMAFGHHEAVIVTLRPGVGEALMADPQRLGEVLPIMAVPCPEPVQQRQVRAADPATIDIQEATRLVAGGRGVGSRAAFDTLRRFADKLGASVAASRMAVDLGWIERARQVGQTGKTVAPEVYIACGISGASHHLEGIMGARHIVAINTDPQAPIFRVAHLGLVADLHAVLARAEEGLSGT